MDEKELTENDQSEVSIQNSILLLTKKKIGISPDDHAFDEDIITDINAVIFSLNLIGIGEEGFSISDASATWTDLLGENVKIYEAVKTFIYLKVKLMFDPPSSSFVVSALEKQISEIEWKLNFKYESKNNEEQNRITQEEIDEICVLPDEG
jgi:hypothetical protein